MVPPGAQLIAGILLAFCDLALGSKIRDGVTEVDQVKCRPVRSNRTIYEFEIESLNGRRIIDFSRYRGKQEPGANATEIYHGLRYVRPGKGFVPHFPLTKKIEVNGLNEHPLWTFLKDHCPSTKDGWIEINKIFQNPYRNHDVRWNFEKFLVDQRGHPFIRYDASVEPIRGITRDIERLLRSPTITPDDCDDCSDDCFEYPL